MEAALPPGKLNLVPIEQEPGLASELVWTWGKENIPAPVGNQTLISQSVASHYTD
jgi:hypothetical protein